MIAIYILSIIIIPYLIGRLFTKIPMVVAVWGAGFGFLVTFGGFALFSTLIIIQLLNRIV